MPQGVGVRLPERPLVVGRGGCLRYEVITSPSNPRIKRAISLREAKHRKREGRILIDGSSSIDRAVASGVKCEEIFARLRWVEGLEAGGLEAGGLDQLRGWLEQSPDTQLLGVGPGAFPKLQYGQKDDDLIAVAIAPETSLSTGSERVARADRELYLVLDRLEKPGNLGAMLRSADAAGVAAVLISDPVCEIWNPNAIRSSLGAVFTLPMVVGSERELKQWLLDRGVCLYAARTDQGVDYAQITYPERVAIVIGNEAMGLADRWCDPGITSISIPMHGVIDSLNASVCGAVMLFEIARQFRSP